jgi:fermentation-respiration switch protein FrsA (DUF1100 family)
MKCPTLGGGRARSAVAFLAAAKELVSVVCGCEEGVPVAEPRITAAVFGLFGHPAVDREAAFARAARQVTIPVLFLLQWDDELFPRDDGFTLFDLLGSRQKTLHANPGGHIQIPRAEISQAVQFLGQHLAADNPAPA